jgi:hypothetical protein
MTWTVKKGFSFRIAGGYVTDAAGDTHIDPAGIAYPTSITVDSDTFDHGYESAFGGRADRDAGVDARLAGMAYVVSGASAAVWRIDVPAGTYWVGLGLGDPIEARVQTATILDDATTRVSIGETSIATGEFIDATGVTRATAAAWAAGQQEVSVNVSSGILRIRVNAPSTDIASINHISIRQATGGSSGTSGRKSLLGVGR